MSISPPFHLQFLEINVIIFPKSAMVLNTFITDLTFARLFVCVFEEVYATI